MVKIGVLLPKLSKKNKSGVPLILDHPVHNTGGGDKRNIKEKGKNARCVLYGA